QINLASRILLNEIKRDTFKNTAIVSVNIPNNITSIGDGAFSKNSHLQTVTIATSSNLRSIGNEAFYKNYNLNYINLSSAKEIVTIGESSFEYCSKLVSIHIPQTLTTIGRYAFAHCESMTSFNFMGNSSLTAFPDYVFYGSQSIDRLNVPASVRTIGERAFYNNNFTKLTFSSSSELSVIGEYAFAKSQKLLSSHLYSNLDEIKEGAFSDCPELRWLVIETKTPPVLHNTTTKIWEENLRIYVLQNALNQYKSAWPQYADRINSSDMIFDDYSIVSENGGAELFQYMGVEKQITIPDTINDLSVVSIGSFAFGKEAHSVTIPDTVTSIKASAFYKSNLTSIEIGENISSIENNPFVYCYELEQIIVDSNNAYYDAVDNALFDKDITTLISYPNAYSENDYVYEIPNTVTKITNSAFRGGINLTQVIISESVAHIGDYAFYDCSDLSDIIFNNPLNLENVGQNAFYNTPYFDNQPIGVMYLTASGASERVAYTYKGEMPEDSEISLHEDTFSILPHAFENRENLDKLHIPYGVEKIGKNILMGSFNITEITVSGNYILGYLFGENEYNNSYLSYNYKTQKTYYVPNSLERINIAEGSYEITSHMFYNIKSVIKVHIPNSVEYIGRFAFYSPDNDMLLVDVEFESLMDSQLEVVGSYAFNNNNNIVQLSLPNNLKRINSYAFKGLSNMTNIIFETEGASSLEYIGASSFADCSSLTELNLPSSVKYISNKAFINCSSIYSISLSRQSELYEIGESAFRNNINLRSFTTADNLAIIGDDAFNGCVSLNDFEYTFSLESLIYMGENVFSNTPYYSLLKSENTNTLIYFGRVAYDYNGFLAEGTLLTLNSNTYSISPNLFNDEEYNISKVTTVPPEEHTETVVVLNITLKRIGRYAFANNTNLTDVTLPPDLQYIGDYAFDGCPSLDNVTFENDENLQHIGNNAFEGSSWYNDYYSSYQNNSVIY
ncbi:MAG: leucine-rich repeat protein, partial [Bacillota bacterium]